VLQEVVCTRLCGEEGGQPGDVRCGLDAHQVQKMGAGAGTNVLSVWAGKGEATAVGSSDRSTKQCPVGGHLAKTRCRGQDVRTRAAVRGGGHRGGQYRVRGRLGAVVAQFKGFGVGVIVHALISH
jgi:hypothetical protein